MSKAMDDEAAGDGDRCAACDKSLPWGPELVLVWRRARQLHCSKRCLDETLRQQRRAVSRRRRRAWTGLVSAVAVALGGGTLWRRFHRPIAEVISSPTPEPLPAAPVPEPVRFGPAWPPTDADWIMAFARSRWVYPLPGVNRRASDADAQLFASDGGKERGAITPAPVCREEGRCGVDLGSDLWGEHVYAVHDGIVDRVHANGDDEGGGQYVRLSHFGGMVFTQYFHLAGVPRTIVRGLHVKAGDLVGLVGDTGVPSGRHHLHFTLSIRPSPAFSEVYWDPRPLLAVWPLRLPGNGTVAGYLPKEPRREAPGHTRARLR